MVYFIDILLARKGIMKKHLFVYVSIHNWMCSLVLNCGLLTTAVLLAGKLAC